MSRSFIRSVTRVQGVLEVGRPLLHNIEPKAPDSRPSHHTLRTDLIGQVGLQDILVVSAAAGHRSYQKVAVGFADQSYGLGMDHHVDHQLLVDSSL